MKQYRYLITITILFSFLVSLTSCDLSKPLSSMNPSITQTSINSPIFSTVSPSSKATMNPEVISSSQIPTVAPVSESTMNPEIVFPSPIPLERINPIEAVIMAPVHLGDKERWYLMSRPETPPNSSGNLAISKVDSRYQYIPLNESGILISIDSGASWTNPMYGSSIGYGLGISNVSQVITDPIEPAKIYGIAGGALFTASDGGEEWQVIHLPGANLLTMAVAGDGNTLYTLSDIGVEVSNNKGGSWTYLKIPIDESIEIGQIALDSEDTQVAYFLINGHLIVTQTGGNDWDDLGILNNLTFREVIADQSIPGLAYAMTEQASVYMTTDNGQTWGVVADLSQYDYLYSLAHLFDADQGRIFLRGLSTQSGTDYENYCGRGLYKSDDSGVTWTWVSPFPVYVTDYADFSCPRVIQLHHVDNSSTLFALVDYGFLTIIKSSDGGSTWKMSEPLNRPISISTSLDGNTIYSCGNLASRSDDGGYTWKDITTNVPNPGTVQYDSITQSINNSKFAYLSSNGSVINTTDGGDTWSESARFGYSPWYYDYYLTVNPANDRTVYLLDPSYYSADAGKTWLSWPTISDAEINSIAVQPGKPDHLAFAGKGLYWSSDGGSTIKLRGFGPDFTVFAIAFDPSMPTRLYAIASTGDQVALYRSDDEAESWAELTSLQSYIDQYSEFQGSLIVDPRSSDTLYLSWNDIYRSTDGGKTWLPFSSGMGGSEDITQMVATSTNPLILYASGNSGVWKITLP